MNIHNALSGLVTIDVEPDNVWQDTHSLGLKNIGYLPAFHSLCLQFGVKPTYLLTWSVASDADSARTIETLLADGGCEVGMHPHLWEIPPLQPKDSEQRALVGPDYPADILAEKLRNLAGLIAGRFGKPRSHRAGRWGVDPRQVPILEELGINADSSVIPGIDWRNTGILDHSKAPLLPYRLGNDSVLVPGDSQVLEVPCTIRPGVRAGGWEKKRFIRSAWRILGLNPGWLRPSPEESPETLTGICRWAAGRLPHLNIMSHSAEMMPGGSPYWTSAADIDAQFDQYRAVFSWWRDNGVVPATLAEFSSRYRDPAN